MEGGMPDREPREVLEELDSFMDDLIAKMRVWEERLRRRLHEGDPEAIVSEAGKGGYFGSRVSEVRARLEEVSATAAPEGVGDGDGDGGGPSEASPKDTEIEMKIEEKCEHVSKNVDRLLDEIADIHDELADRIKRSAEDISDIDDYFDDADE